MPVRYAFAARVSDCVAGVFSSTQENIQMVRPVHAPPKCSKPAEPKPTGTEYACTTQFRQPGLRKGSKILSSRTTGGVFWDFKDSD